MRKVYRIEYVPNVVLLYKRAYKLSYFYCATVGFGLESANVVGFQEVGLRFGAKGAGACFVNIDGKAVDLQDLKVTGYDVEEGYADEEAYVQTLDAFGRTIASYYWYDSKDDGMYGWYDGDGEYVEGMTIAAGEGLYAYAPDDSFAIQSAGQGPTSDIMVGLRFGAKHVVNSTPVAINLQALSATGYDVEEGYADEEVYVQTLDAFGRTIASYYWYDSEEDGMYGWYDEDGEYVEELEVAPGESVYAYAPDNSFSIVLPGVDL